ncbi:wall-associated receptor kinase 5-like protein [Tanacetum coccineum]
MEKANDPRSQSIKEQANNVDRDKDHKSSTEQISNLIDSSRSYANSERKRLQRYAFYMSTRIFHRDIKPGNILFDESFNSNGNLHPDFLRRFTTKSNVYAFDVVPKELLTKRKYVASIDSDEGLIIRF